MLDDFKTNTCGIGGEMYGVPLTRTVSEKNCDSGLPIQSVCFKKTCGIGAECVAFFIIFLIGAGGAPTLLVERDGCVAGVQHACSMLLFAPSALSSRSQKVLDLWKHPTTHQVVTACRLRQTVGQSLRAISRGTSSWNAHPYQR